RPAVLAGKEVSTCPDGVPIYRLPTRPIPRTPAVETDRVFYCAVTGTFPCSCRRVPVRVPGNADEIGPFDAARARNFVSRPGALRPKPLEVPTRRGEVAISARRAADFSL